ncbi:bifunctional diguanylate cyclase/phosphodiesterase [Paenisporosarcina sp. TG20]|uniref:sensor domain-containing protein n=1 Tax=Paenisporosarcina sp. TG20 TaxID=1211706 RepID=UPI0002E26AF7|nr:bifunctional diguanylate cyclase/phosphodiesterase [Paenisporosarcina sp. TG20]
MKNVYNKEDVSDSHLEKTQKDASFYKEMFEVMIRNSPVSVYMIENWNFTYVNKNFCSLVGYTEEEIFAGRINNLIHPEDLFLVQGRNTGEETDARYRVRINKKDGDIIHVEIHSTKLVRNGKKVLFGTVFDVTKEVTANILLKESQERFKSLFYNNPDAIFTFDLEGDFTDANPGCEVLSGYSKDELIDMSFTPLIVSEDLATTLNYFVEATQGIANSYEITITRKDGKRRNLEISSFPMKHTGKIVGTYGIAKDITEKYENRKLMEELVFYDSLTKLPNRKLFEDRLKQVFIISETNKNQPTVLFLDLDRFKFINDSLGHHLGDEFLKTVSKRLTNNVGETDTVGRFGGDEFAILLPNTDRNETILIAQKLNHALAQPFDVMGHSLSITASIGIAVSNGAGESVDGLIKKADTAMYYTKEFGKNSYTFYSAELDQKTAYKLTIEKDLKNAINNNEFVLYYQPIIDLKTRELTGMEALIRWNHPELGLVPPDNFIPISEESGEIIPIGKWVLYTACSQNKAWQHLGIPPFKICVNISVIQLQQSNIVQTVKSILDDTGLDSQWLELEITESILLEDTKTLKENLLNLKALGISMSIDDFGTGYTSLSYLRQFSFDRVKIDRSFIGDIGNDSHAKAITSTIISLAQKLSMGVIAEGIEGETQLSYLQAENCDQGQGYYFSRPLPADQHELSNHIKKYF